MLGNIGGAELLLIMLVILLVFGAKRIPEIARGLGQGIREFKKAASEVSRELKAEDERQAARPVPPTAAGSDLGRTVAASPPQSKAPHMGTPPLST